MGWHIQNAEERILSTKILYLEKKTVFQHEGEIKTVPDKQELRVITRITPRPTLQEMLKEILQIEIKGH